MTTVFLIVLGVLFLLILGGWLAYRAGHSKAIQRVVNAGAALGKDVSAVIQAAKKK